MSNFRDNMTERQVSFSPVQKFPGGSSGSRKGPRHLLLPRSPIDGISGQLRTPRTAVGRKFVAECNMLNTPLICATGGGPGNTTTTATDFSRLRYTAATCDPDDFTVANGYSLRGRAFNRPTELLIAITSFNENASMYARTFAGVFANIRDICTSQSSKYWQPCEEVGNPAWQRITVALVVDGLEEMDTEALEYLTGVGVVQQGVMRRQVDGLDTVAHIFESVISSNEPNSKSVDAVPIQFILIIKAKNQKKINSHRWIFNAIGRMLEPEVCVLIDAGTKPGTNAIYYLWEAFHVDPCLGGSCGEIHTMGGKLLLNPLVAAQNFEYKMSNILDKPLESTFGYVTVLPGAFSAYRYRAIQGRPLEQYFKGDHSLSRRLGRDGMQGMSIFQKNMFLAEDRILCFELIAKEGEKWTISYVKASKAETDVPECAPELIGQRRRWLNGALAANIYALANFRRLYRSAHGPRQMVLYHVQAVYNAVSLLFAWFSLANVWLGFSIMLDSIAGHGPARYAAVIQEVSRLLKLCYLASLAVQFLLAFGNRPKSQRVAYDATLWFYGFLTIYVAIFPKILSYLTSSVTLVAGESIHPSSAGVLGSGSVLIPLTSTIGIYVVSSLLYLEPWHLLHSSWQYLCMGPSFVNVLTVYAFCNLHDVSWGTKGCDKMEVLTPMVSSFPTSSTFDFHSINKSRRDRERVDAKKNAAIEDAHKDFRTRVVLAWLFSNAVLAFSVENYGGWINCGASVLPEERHRLEGRRGYLSLLITVAYCIVLFRFVGCLVYWARDNFLGWWRKH